MLSEDQKRILGYFIEEAKDHLNTIEQGLLNLQTTIEDAEMVNEVFRAAHSVKGGAAMLGLSSIQRTAHRLEDFFKLMKESPIQADQDLESMLLQIFDGLQEQLEHLEGPYGLSDEQAQAILTNLEPVFAQTDSHLQNLVAAAPTAPKAAPVPAAKAARATVTHPETSALQLVFQSDVPALLREMLAAFKKTDSAATRQELGQICQRLRSIGEQFELSHWCELLGLASTAVANEQQTFRTLAPVIIKDLKRSQDLVLAGHANQIAATSELQALLPSEPAVAEDASALDALLAEALDEETGSEPDLADLFAVAEREESVADLADPDDSWLEQVTQTEMDDVDGLEAAFDSLTTEVLHPNAAANNAKHAGVEVGAAELNSLADLFEGDPEGLAGVWEEEELTDHPAENTDSQEAVPDIERDLADLLETSESSNASSPNASQGSVTDDDDLISLFGQSLDEAPSETGDAASLGELDELPVDFAAESDSVAAGAVATDPGQMASNGPAMDVPWEGTEEALDDFFDVDTPPATPEQTAAPVATEELDDFFDAEPALAEVTASPDEADSSQGAVADEAPQDAAAIASPAISQPAAPEPGAVAPETAEADESGADLDALFDATDEAAATVDQVTGSFDALLEDFPGDDGADLANNVAGEATDGADTSGATGDALNFDDLDFSDFDSDGSDGSGDGADQNPFDDLDAVFASSEQHDQTATADLPDAFAPSDASEGVYLDFGDTDAPAAVEADSDDDLELNFDGAALQVPAAESTATDGLDLDVEFDNLDNDAVTAAQGQNGLEGEAAPPTKERVPEEAATATAGASNLEDFDADFDLSDDVWGLEADSATPETEDSAQVSDVDLGDLNGDGGRPSEATAPAPTDGSLAFELDDVGADATPGVAKTTADFDAADFDDLEDLLNQPATSASGPQEDDSFEDSFEDLDALLDDAALSTEADFPMPGEAGHTARVEESGDVDLDEFSDLEKLLEDTDQLGGSSPTMSSRRASAAPTARRVPRRTTTVTDQTMRVSVSHLDILSNLVGELVVNRNSLEQDQERLRQFLDNLLFQVQQLNDVGQRMRDLYERSLLESSLISSRQTIMANASGNGDSNSHSTGATFDALEMDRFTGFHTLSQEMIELIVRVREAASDIEFTVDSSDQITRQFRQVTTQLQEGLNKARMVPFGQTADRLPRAVRDISLKCGKEAKLVVEGRDTLIDKMILERLYDPVTHLVNNAITHGIEPPAEREAQGKARAGTITIRAFYQGNQTVIYIADDGGGINPEIVKQKALKRGLISPTEAASMSEVEVYDLLFLPGFSTRDQADDFSGRGVGMDVVRTALSEIRGAITIESNLGQGTSFTIRLPLTLSITKALSCVNNQARIAFPMDGVEDMLDVPRERIQSNEQGVSCILWRDTLLPFRPLNELLQFNRSLGRGRVYGGANDDNAISIVVLRSASSFIGLQVDQVIGEQEIVIKQLEGPVPKPTGIAGATVMGDGRVMPIADVLELIDLSTGRVRREPAPSLWGQTAEEDTTPIMAREEPTVLIVDDSITVRELLSMSFNKVGYRVEQARDGQEAWEKLRSGLPCDLVFCDIEMPRMDGLELLSRLQKDEQLSRIPIAMLTSRGADRHRQMAVDLGASGYFTKPYLEEMLLDAAKRMLEGEKMMGTTADI